MSHLSWDDAMELAASDGHDGPISDNVLLRHADSCARCAHTLQRARQVHSALVQDLRLPDAVVQRANDDALWANIRAAIEVDAPPQRGSNAARASRRVLAGRARWSRWTAICGSGAAILVIAAIAVTRLQSTAGRYPTDQPMYGLNNGGVLTSRPRAYSTPATRNGTAQGLAPTAGSSGKSSTSSTTAESPNVHMNKTATSGAGIAAPARMSGAIAVRAWAEPGAGRSTPLSGAHVALVSAAGIDASTLTGAGGRAQPVTISAPVSTWSRWLSTVTKDAVLLHGTATVVVWKSGYQPAVVYDVPVGSTSHPLAVDVTLRKSTSSAMQSAPTASSWPLSATVQAAVGSALAAGASTDTGVHGAASAGGRPLRVQVTDQSGGAAIGARVVVLSAADGPRSVDLAGDGSTPTQWLRGGLEWGVPSAVVARAGNPREVSIVVYDPTAGRRLWPLWAVPLPTQSWGVLRVKLGVEDGQAAPVAVPQAPERLSRALVAYVLQAATSTRDSGGH